MQQVIAAIHQSVDEGASLHAALAHHPNVFEIAYLHLVEVGEATGLLGVVFERLAERSERADALRRKIRSALTYPALVLGVALAASVFVLTTVVPTFANLYADFGVTLPRPTRALLAFGGIVTGYWWLISLLITAMVYGASRLLQTSQGRLWSGRIELRMPVVGSMLKSGLSARTARTLCTLLGSGVSLLPALQLVERSERNVHFERLFSQAHERLRRGGSLSDVLHGSWLLAPFLVQMIEAGEHAGTLHETLAHAADHLEKDVETRSAALASLLEPVLILVIGALMGALLIALYLPLLDITNAIQ